MTTEPEIPDWDAVNRMPGKPDPALEHWQIAHEEVLKTPDQIDATNLILDMMGSRLRVPIPTHHSSRASDFTEPIARLQHVADMGSEFGKVTIEVETDDLLNVLGLLWGMIEEDNES